MKQRTLTGCVSFWSDNLESKIQNLKWARLLVILVLLVGCAGMAEAEEAKVYRVGVIHQGGPYKAVVDGLRDGLRQLGYEEGKQHPPGNPGYKE